MLQPEFINAQSKRRPESTVEDLERECPPSAPRSEGRLYVRLCWHGSSAATTATVTATATATAVNAVSDSNCIAERRHLPVPSQEFDDALPSSDTDEGDESSDGEQEERAVNDEGMHDAGTLRFEV